MMVVEAQSCNVLHKQKSMRQRTVQWVVPHVTTAVYRSAAADFVRLKVECARIASPSSRINARNAKRGLGLQCSVFMYVGYKLLLVFAI